MFASFGNASFLSDLVDGITWKVTKTMKKAGIYKTISISSDNTTGSVTDCLGCGGESVITALKNSIGEEYFVSDSTSSYIS